MLACSTVLSVVLPCLIDAAYIGSLATREVPESWHFLRKSPKSPSSEMHAGYQSPASGLQKHAQSWLLPRIYTVFTSCLTFWENVRLSDKHKARLPCGIRTRGRWRPDDNRCVCKQGLNRRQEFKQELVHLWVVLKMQRSWSQSDFPEENRFLIIF